MHPGAALRLLDEELWTHRVRLQRLAFRSRVAKLVLAADDRRSAQQAVSELAEAVLDVRRADHAVRSALQRAVAATAAPAVDLTGLAGHLGDRVGDQLVEHATAFDGLVDEIGASTMENRALAGAGINNVRVMMAALTGGDTVAAPSYDRSGGAVSPDRPGLDALL